MHRRKFVKNSTLIALSIGVFGKIEYANGAFIGDTPTTTDVLGPYYRPGSPLRTNITPFDFNGTPLHLSGTIYKADGKTPLKSCLIEVGNARMMESMIFCLKILFIVVQHSPKVMGSIISQPAIPLLMRQDHHIFMCAYREVKNIPIL